MIGITSNCKLNVKFQLNFSLITSYSKNEFTRKLFKKKEKKISLCDLLPVFSFFFYSRSSGKIFDNIIDAHVQLFNYMKIFFFIQNILRNKHQLHKNWDNRKYMSHLNLLQDPKESSVDNANLA